MIVNTWIEFKQTNQPNEILMRLNSISKLSEEEIAVE